jgi:hypothetical protein
LSFRGARSASPESSREENFWIPAGPASRPEQFPVCGHDHTARGMVEPLPFTVLISFANAPHLRPIAALLVGF